MGHVQFRRALAPDGQIDNAVLRVVDFFDENADGLSSLEEALGLRRAMQV